jgi:hypothetical protein
MKREKDEIAKREHPNASLYLRDRYTEQDIEHIFAYLERK